MADFRKVTIGLDSTVIDAIQAIDRGAVQIALVVDAEGILLGTVTDGDIRRGLLRGIDLHGPVANVIHAKPRTVRADEGKEAAYRLMRRLEIHHMPVVDGAGRLVGLELLDDLVKLSAEDTWVVLMAGGKGTRLMPLTASTPKPLLAVGGKPLIETIIGNFIDQGFQRFFLSLNYKAEMFRSHFGDGSRLGVSIEYLHETEALGTAGALSLLPERPTSPMIVMNGDLLTSVDFRNLLIFHREHKAAATMCVRDYSFQVPYGVVEIDGTRLMGIVEKPVRSCFVSAGIYALEPEMMDLLPGGYCDMPNLFEAARTSGRETLAFPVREYWLDIGRIADLERARTEFDEVFGG